LKVIGFILGFFRPTSAISTAQLESPREEEEPVREIPEEEVQEEPVNLDEEPVNPGEPAAEETDEIQNE
jgi:hypothetical protein